MVLADSHEIPRAPCYSGTHSPQPSKFRLPGYHRLRPCFPTGSTTPTIKGLPTAVGRKMRPTTPHMQRPQALTHTRFSHHPLSLATTHRISLPTGTKMFHFPAFPPHTLYIQVQVTSNNTGGLSPFGHPRITARLPTPRGLSQATTSFFGSQCQGIHRTPLQTYKITQTKDAHVHYTVTNQPPTHHKPPTSSPQRKAKGHQPQTPIACRSKFKEQEKGPIQPNHRRSTTHTRAHRHNIHRTTHVQDFIQEKTP